MYGMSEERIGQYAVGRKDAGSVKNLSYFWVRGQSSDW